jgi:hypothetical protein
VQTLQVFCLALRKKTQYVVVVALDLFVCVVYVAFDLFVYMVQVAPIGSKHESESLFQNLVADIVEVQTLGGIVLLGGDFNAHTAALPNTINTSDFYELL